MAHLCSICICLRLSYRNLTNSLSLGSVWTQKVWNTIFISPVTSLNNVQIGFTWMRLESSMTWVNSSLKYIQSQKLICKSMLAWKKDSLMHFTRVKKTNCLTTTIYTIQECFQNRTRTYNSKRKNLKPSSTLKQAKRNRQLTKLLSQIYLSKKISSQYSINWKRLISNFKDCNM
jgi:hypothetical protein